MRKLAAQLESNTDAIYTQSQAGAIDVASKQVEEFQTKSRELSSKINQLKNNVNTIGTEVEKLRP